MWLIVLVVLVSLAGSFLCSLCEAALFAVTPTRVETLRSRGIAGASKLAQLRGHIDVAIAGILTFNSITQTVGAAWAGAMVGGVFGNRWLGAFVPAFALTMLFLTEILPKSLGVSWASVVAPRVSWLIQGMIWSVWPLAKLSTLITRRITRRAPGQRPSEEELLVMADLAAEGGAILPEELRWVRNVLRLNNVTARDLMTPRNVVCSLPADLPLDRVQMRAAHWVHSRLPLVDDRDPGRVVGIVQRRAVFDKLISGDRTGALRDLMRPALVVPEHAPGHKLLEQFISQHQHLAVVSDSHDRLCGVVSLEDVLEYLLGRDIVAEHDRHPEMQRLARERARFHASASRHGAESADRPMSTGLTGEPNL
jgi:CBS domain containing-hemolysin-like protein